MKTRCGDLKIAESWWACRPTVHKQVHGLRSDAPKGRATTFPAQGTTEPASGTNTETIGRKIEFNQIWSIATAKQNCWIGAKATTIEFPENENLLRLHSRIDTVETDNDMHVPYFHAKITDSTPYGWCSCVWAVSELIESWQSIAGGRRVLGQG